MNTLQRYIHHIGKAERTLRYNLKSTLRATGLAAMILAEGCGNDALPAPERDMQGVEKYDAGSGSVASDGGYAKSDAMSGFRDDAGSDACVLQTYFLDNDGDSYGLASEAIESCDKKLPKGYAAVPGDCDDNNPNIFPGAEEVCDRYSNDCNEPDAADGDGEEAPLNSRQSGVCADSVQSCIDGNWQDDYRGLSGYLNEEICDGLDNNCNSIIDDALLPPSRECFSSVGGCREAGAEYQVCEGPAGWSADFRNCNAVAGEPAEEICNGLDDNCDGTADNNLTPSSLECTSGLGECERPGLEYLVCLGAAGWSADYRNCDAVPGEASEELCDGLDNDCDGETDEGIGPTLEWSRTYNGPASRFDVGTGIALDQEERALYVVGRDEVSRELWNIILLNYSLDGDPLWAGPVRYAPAGGSGMGWGVAVDLEGSIYVTGSAVVSEPRMDAWVNKYNRNGAPLWSSPITYNGSSNWDDEGRGIAVSAGGEVYVTGYEYVTSEAGNILLNSYRPDGIPRWGAPVLYNGPANAWDVGNAVAVDQAGDVYVTGYVRVSGEGKNILINKYSPGGSPLWAEPITHQGSSGGDDEGRGIVIQEGEVTVVGGERVSEGGSNLWLNKYDLNGNPLWPSHVSFDAGPFDYGHGIAADQSGNHYVIGSVNTGNQKIMVHKYSPDGEPLWDAPFLYEGPGNGFEEGYGVAVDSEGHIYAVGRVVVSIENSDLWLGKLTQCDE